MGLSGLAKSVKDASAEARTKITNFFKTNNLTRIGGKFDFLRKMKAGLQSKVDPEVEGEKISKEIENDSDGVSDAIDSMNEAIESAQKTIASQAQQISRLEDALKANKTEFEQMKLKFEDPEFRRRVDAADPSPAGSKTWYNRIYEKVANNKLKVAAGLGISGMAIHAHLVHEHTDGVTANIRTITINPDATSATISFDLPNGDVLFQPAEGDTITLANTGGLEPGNDYVITEVVNDTQIKISLSSLTNTGFLQPFRGTIMCQSSACSTVPGSPTPQAPTFTCHSDFGNQFLSNWRDLMYNVGRAIGEGLGVMIDAAGNVVERLISPVFNVLDRVADATGNAFCKAVPFLCELTTWLMIIGGIIISIIIFSLINKK